MVSDSFLVLILNLVGHLTSVNQLVNTCLDSLGAHGNLFNNLLIALGKLCSRFGREDIIHARHVLSQLALIVCAHRYDVVHRQVAKHTSLNLYLLCISFPFHLVASFQLLACHHVLAFKHLDGALVEIALKNLRARCLAVKTTAGSLFLPFV